jgi:decaprenylphospho-beta-D-ribofuranose 2-oxidase
VTEPNDEQLLTGWGGTAPSRARLVTAGTADELRDVMSTTNRRGAIARGLGRSYGAPAQNAGGTVLDLAGQGGTPRLDVEAATVTAHAGISFDALMKFLVPRGFFVPVTPGTRQVTLGGAIAADIHGKNHHLEGSLGNHIVNLHLFLADGSVMELAPDQHAELFWATVGGMGLTGVILDATIKVLPIETSRMVVDTERTSDLDDVCARMASGDHRYRYSVAWVDLLAKGKHVGRSVLTRGDHAPLDALSGRAAAQPFAFNPQTRLTAPSFVPNGLLNPLSIRVFNEFWYRKAPKQRTDQVCSIGSFFHPLDMIRSWGRLYGPQGFVQYQIAIPFGEERVLRTCVERLANSGDSSFLVVLKRFGESNQGPLSFPMPGWTITLDVAAGRPGLSHMLQELDHLVLDAGGRHYLAKDAHMTADAMRRGYPRLEEWKAIRDKVDPTGVWRSDLSRRLELTSP